MVNYLGASPADADKEVTVTRCAHAQFTYLRAFLQSHLREVRQDEMDEDVACIHMYWGWAIKTYLLFTVGATIFSNKAKNYVDLTYLLYLRDIGMVNMYVRGPATLSFLYKELSNATVTKCKYLARYATFLQVTKHL
jgi:hypothetical protein